MAPRFTRQRGAVLQALMAEGGVIDDPGGRATALLAGVIAEVAPEAAQSRNALKRTLATMERDGLVTRDTEGRRTRRIALAPEGTRMAVDRGVVAHFRGGRGGAPLPEGSLAFSTGTEAAEQFRHALIASAQRALDWAESADFDRLTPWDVLLEIEAASFGDFEVTPTVDQLSRLAARSQGAMAEIRRQWSDYGTVPIEHLDTMLRLNYGARRMLHAMRARQARLQRGAAVG